MPRDRRLVALCTALLNEPDSPETIREWCTRLGMSERTLARLFQRQTGESFGRWRQRIRLHHARAQLEAGESVTAVALNWRLCLRFRVHRRLQETLRAHAGPTRPLTRTPPSRLFDTIISHARTLKPPSSRRPRAGTT